MAKADWSHSAVMICEDIDIISLEPRIAVSTYFVEVFQRSSHDDPIIKIKCDDREKAEAVCEALQDVDFETFTSIEDL
jgi:hypothetical protein